MEEGEEDGHGQGGDQGAGSPVPEHGAGREGCSEGDPWALVWNIPKELG